MYADEDVRITRADEDVRATRADKDVRATRADKDVRATLIFQNLKFNTPVQLPVLISVIRHLGPCFAIAL